MIDEIIELLELLGYPAYRQGSLSEEYPDTFFTFWQKEEVPTSHYDNDVFMEREEYNIYVYSTNPETVYNLLDKAKALLIDSGWAWLQSFDAPSGNATHTGRGMIITKLKDGGNDNV